jgi:hypothetical protein
MARRSLGVVAVKVLDWRRNALADRFHHVVLCLLFLDALELLLAAGFPCCAAGTKVKILHPFALTRAGNPQLLAVLVLASDQSRK